MNEKPDMTGETFGQLSVVSSAPSKGGAAYWKVFCACGKEKTVSAKRLRSGAVASCGCEKAQPNALLLAVQALTAAVQALTAAMQEKPLLAASLPVEQEKPIPPKFQPLPDKPKPRKPTPEERKANQARIRDLGAIIERRIEHQENSTSPPPDGLNPEQAEEFALLLRAERDALEEITPDWHGDEQAKFRTEHDHYSKIYKESL